MKKTIAKGMALAFVGSLLMAGSALALTYTPTLSDIFNWELLDSTPSLTTFTKSELDSTIKFTGIFEETPTTPAYATIGMDYAAGNEIDLTGYNFYSLYLQNVNGSTWDYKLFLEDTDGDVELTSAVSLSTPGATTLNFDLSTLSLVDIDSIAAIGFQIGFSLPRTDSFGDDDYVFETKVAPVPEPATMLLMGSGLAGLAGVARRRSKKA